ncbi:MAG TPA: haloalkane dehalogenase [Thermomicrobiales bacterium]|jgi:haloalkane dehalogenase
MPSADIPVGIGSHTIAVKDSWLHYLEAGSGDPILFLHGNPTSAYLWRDVIPHVAPHGRCLAVDLIGMGRSGKPPLAYRLIEHIAYIDTFIDALGLNGITFVGHDWGVAIALHYLKRFPERVRAVAFMEGHIHPIARWDDFDAGGRAMFGALRTEGVGRTMAIDDNFFIETVLPSGVQRTLTAAEMDAYRAPYLAPQDREPLWRWPNEIPIAGYPADVHAIIHDNQATLAASTLPKLLCHATRGATIGPAEVAWCRQTLSNLTTIDLGPGVHFLPEDHPDMIGTAIGEWLGKIG